MGLELLPYPCCKDLSLFLLALCVWGRRETFNSIGVWLRRMGLVVVGTDSLGFFLWLWVPLRLRVLADMVVVVNRPPVELVVYYWPEM